MIPPFTTNGKLPPGVHQASWQEFTARFGTTQHRRRLLDGLETAATALRKAGCHTVYVDGSFVTSKHRPNDYDACWDLDGVDLDLLDPVFFRFSNNRAAQKAKYLGELFPSHYVADDEGTIYLVFFQRDRQKRPKGIVALSLEGW